MLLNTQLAVAYFYPDFGLKFTLHSDYLRQISSSTIQAQTIARMYIPIYPAQSEALQRHAQATEKYTDEANHPLVAISTFTKKVPSSIQRRSNSGTNTNLIIGLVVGFTLAAFIVSVCVFLYCYGDSIKFYKKKQRHRRRSSSSKGSRHSKHSKEVEHTEGAAEGERGEA